MNRTARLNRFAGFTAMAAGTCLPLLCRAAADADSAAAVTTITDSFGGIKTVVLSVVLFGVVLGFIKMLKRK